MASANFVDYVVIALYALLMVRVSSRFCASTGARPSIFGAATAFLGWSRASVVSWLALVPGPSPVQPVSPIARVSPPLGSISETP